MSQKECCRTYEVPEWTSKMPPKALLWAGLGSIGYGTNLQMPARLPDSHYIWIKEGWHNAGIL